MLNHEDLKDLKDWLNTDNDPVFIRVDYQGIEHWTITLTDGEVWNVYHTLESGYLRASKH